MHIAPALRLRIDDICRRYHTWAKPPAAWPRRPPWRCRTSRGARSSDFATSSPAGQPALAVRWHGQVFGYVNECAHASVPIDFERQVFDRSKTYLMCARHGAIYAPDTGLCVGGPCRGSSLDALAVREADGAIWLDDAGTTR